MQAMILAAGFGSRLKPLTSRVPKALVGCAGIRLVDCALDLVMKAGIRRVVINTHHLGEELERRLNHWKPSNMELIWSHEEEIRGTGGGLQRARHHFDETVLVINADILIDFDVAAMAYAHKASGALATMALHPADEGEDLGVVRTDFEDRVRDIVGGVTKLEEGPGWDPKSTGAPQLYSEKGSPHYFRGVHMLEPEFLARIPDDEFSCIIRETYIPEIHRGTHIHGHVIHGRWADAGTPERLLAAHHLFWPEETDEPIIEQGAYVGLKTVLKGRTYVCAGANIGHSCILDDCIVQPDAVVPPKTLLKGAIIHGKKGQHWTP